VCPADLHDPVELPALHVERVAQGADAWDQALDERHRDGHVERRREGVVARLAPVDIVVRVDRLLAAAGSGRDLVGPASDHLVDVHVR
jgi:hypothetical protein